MDIKQAVKTVLANYANFEGRSGRAEYWWWALAFTVAYAAVYILGGILGTGILLAQLFAVALLIPSIAVAVRRLHDVGLSGWWCLLAFAPIANLVFWLIFFTKPSVGPNQYGPGPLEPVS